jgi:cytochrome c551/c552
MARTEFLFDKNKEPHLARTAAILKKHPEMPSSSAKKPVECVGDSVHAIAADYAGMVSARTRMVHHFARRLARGHDY